MLPRASSLRPLVITGITVGGFKSLREESRIEVRPLTILAGANSSGKSSIMQPLLMMKQTLEAPYDPGVFLLDGPNVRFTDSSQFFLWEGKDYKNFTVQIETPHRWLKNVYRKISGKRQIEIVEMIHHDATKEVAYRPRMTFEEFAIQIPADELNTEIERVNRVLRREEHHQRRFEVTNLRCFLRLYGDKILWHTLTRPSERFVDSLLNFIHVPGLRLKPERTYNTASGLERIFIGTFENYIASIINAWQETQDRNLTKLSIWLKENLQLTSSVGAKAINDTQIELRVGRTLKSDEQDTVSLADVGFGVSQVLPVLVALLVAEPGQLVYIEQPELHLHPRAQHKLAQVLADAANRGVRVVIETHSDLLLLGVQTLVAEGKLDSDKVILHWFERSEDGASKITSRKMDESGAYGDWPEDFSDVDLRAQSRYLDAATLKQEVNGSADEKP